MFLSQNSLEALSFKGKCFLALSGLVQEEYPKLDFIYACGKHVDPQHPNVVKLWRHFILFILCFLLLPMQVRYRFNIIKIVYEQSTFYMVKGITRATQSLKDCFLYKLAMAGDVYYIWSRGMPQFSTTPLWNQMFSHELL